MSGKQFPFIPYRQETISDEQMLENAKSLYHKVDKRRSYYILKQNVIT